jgi:L-iditol 2-dehydrogenase
MSISVVWPGREGVEVKPRDVPPPGPGELKIRIEASGLCGTDLHIASGEYPFARPGVTIGHEFAGTIVEVGPDVEGFGVRERVVVDPNIPCRTCEYCHDSRPHLCVRPQALGVTLNGGLSEFAVLPAPQAYRVPEGLPSEAAALLVAAGSSEVLVSEPDPGRRDRVREVGAVPVEPESLTEGMADRVFECVGRPETMRAAVETAKPGGTVVWVGVAPPEAEVSIRPYDVFRRELTIRGTYTNPFTMGRSLALLASGRIDWKSIVTHRIPIARFEEAWETHREGTGLKVCVYPGDG